MFAEQVLVGEVVSLFASKYDQVTSRFVFESEEDDLTKIFDAFVQFGGQIKELKKTWSQAPANDYKHEE